MIKNKYILRILYGSIWIILYFLPREFMHIGGKDGIEPWIIFGLTFFVLPYILYILLLDSNVKLQNAKVWALGSVFLTAPYIWLITIEDNAELEKYKAKSIGIVTSADIVHRRENKSVWTIQAEYRINDKTYMTSYKEDEDHLLNKGDTITIIYSSKTPQMSEVLELIEYYKR